MKYDFVDGGVLISQTGDFVFENIFDNGQCFRFVPENDYWHGVAYSRYLRLRKVHGDVFMYPVSEADFRDVWFDYFDLGKDYSSVFPDPDPVLSEGISYAPGLRLLNQEPFETLVSFIISANNNISRIRKIISRMCESFGEKKKSAYGYYYCFPTPDVLASLSEADLYELGAGYRSPYIIETAAAVNSGDVDLCSLSGLDYFEARKQLLKLKGVGPKVADCILLFSLGHRRAFPCDVWIKRVLADDYGFAGNDRETADFVFDKFGDNAGLAQQYLFYRKKNS